MAPRDAGSNSVLINSAASNTLILLATVETGSLSFSAISMIFKFLEFKSLRISTRERVDKAWATVTNLSGR